MVDFRDGNIESGFEPADQTFDYAAFFLERLYRLQMQMSFHNSTYHGVSFQLNLFFENLIFGKVFHLLDNI